MDKSLEKTIAEKASLLHTIVANKFGGNAEAAATSGEETQTGGGTTMKVTRSAASGAPGEVQDGKLVDVKSLAAAAARNDVPPTDLLALARQNDPHNENTIPTTIAGAVTASEKGLPGQEVAEDHSKDMGNLDEESKKSLHQKQHAPIEKAVETKVESQVSEKDPYKTLHAGAEIDAIVARATAVLKGADKIKAAASEVAHPGAGKVEDGGQGKVEGDAGKNAVDSAKTLGDGGKPKAAALDKTKSRADVLAAIRSERKAKVEGALEDPAKGGAAQTPEEGAKSMGDGGSEKSASTKVAESKDRPLASMPEGKKRYPADDDNRDEEAASYWKKNKADEARFEKEPKEDRPITREMQEKLPALASRRLNLITRLAGLSMVLAASEDEAARLHLKKRHYNQDKAEDMDYGGAASRTKSEINKEHGQRSSDSGSLSPMMSRLWSAYMPNVKLASNEAGYKGEIDKDGDKKKQVAEMQKALKGLKAEDKGAEAEMASMEKKIGDMEADLAKSSGINLGQKSISALATAQDRIAVICAALGDIGRLCRASHMEVKFALEKPHGTGVSNDMVGLLEDLGETIDDMEGVLDQALKEMGHPGLKDADKWKNPGGEHGEEPGAEMPKGPEMPPMAEEEPKGPPAPEGALPDLGAKSQGAVKTAFESEDEAVEKLASDKSLSDEQRRAKANELRASAKWTAVFEKVASKADASKPDMLASYWKVMRGEEPVLKVSMSDAYPVKTAAEQAEAFAWFATKDYGLKLLASAKFDGVARTAKLLGLSPLVKSAAAGAALDKKIESEKAYYSKAYGSSEFAAELLKDHEKKAAADRKALEDKIAALEAEKKAQTERNDRLQADLAMRAKAAKALDLANKALSKGMFGTEHKAKFIDDLMLGDDNAYKVASTMVENFKPVAAPQGEKKAEVTAKELLRIAAAGPGLKTPIVSEASAPAGLTDQLNSMWKVPPTAKQ